MAWFGIGQKAGTVVFWIAVLVAVCIGGYFLTKSPLVWPQQATVVEIGQYYKSGRMIDTFNNIPEIIYPITVKTPEGKTFVMTLSKEDYARVQPGQQIKYMKNPLASSPQYRLK